MGICFKENEMRKGTSAIMRDMESKVDRYELDPLKEYIEKQLKKIKKLQVFEITILYYFIKDQRLF
jgi:hypothetical protein